MFVKLSEAIMRIDRDLDKTILIDIPILNDERGFLAPLTDNVDPNLIKRACFVGDYGRSVIRGLHYHKKEWKFYAVLTGAAKFLSVDIPEELIQQEGAESKIKSYLIDNPASITSYVLSYRSPKMLVIPPHRANGWISLEEGTNVLFLSNLVFEEARLDDYRYHHSVVSSDYWGAS